MPSSTLQSPKPMAHLSVIKFSNLSKHDAAELMLLKSACQEEGFFYLDLDEDSNEHYLNVVRDVFKDAKGYFGQSLEIKLQDSKKGTAVANVCGFKPLGTETGVVEGKKDGFEAFKLPTDHVYRVGDQGNLRILGMQTHLQKLDSFVKSSENICTTIMTALSDALESEIGLEERLEWHHRPEAGSDSVAVINHYPLKDIPSHASIGHNAHTDMGSLTLLFCSDWGLQVYSSDKEGWENVVPRPRSAIVNIGDSLRFLTHQNLKSCLHRVVPHETWSSKDRYSLAYFLRPNRDKLLTDADGKRWTAEEWNDRKFKSYGESHAEQQLSSVQTGREQFSGVWCGQSTQ